MSKKKAKARADAEKKEPAPGAWLPAKAGFHCRVGWWSLLVFLTLGFVLEIMFWLKLDWYVDASNETRRLMWRLAHAHGTLLSLVHLGFGLTLHVLLPNRAGLCKLASRCLLGAGVLFDLRRELADVPARLPGEA